MKVAIMQPYLFPYIGYFQLIDSVDLFIIYDNIKYTKKGWINKNRFLRNGSIASFSVNLNRDSDFLNIVDRRISNDFNKNKLLNRFKESYRKAPYFEQAFCLIERVILQQNANLFMFIYNSILEVCNYLLIDSKIMISSNIKINHSLRKQDKVIAICQEVGADCYVNAIGGQQIYSKDEFNMYGIELSFLKSHPFKYKQFDNEFVPGLSIIDVMMFNSRDKIRENICNYNLI